MKNNKGFKMRFLFLLILFVVFSYVPTYSAGVANRGQENITHNLVTWKTGKTRLLFLSNNVYLDTSATGQGRQFARIDNTEDSCSNPFSLIADTNFNTPVHPVYLNKLWMTAHGVAAANNSVSFRVQTREKVYDNGPYAFRFTPWTLNGANSGHSGAQVSDTLVARNTGTTVKYSQYIRASYEGGWARLCPDDNDETANGAADSVYRDSLFHTTR